jgi:hypothetical protein
MNKCQCGHHKNAICHSSADVAAAGNCCCGGFDPVAERSDVVSKSSEPFTPYKAVLGLEEPSVDGGARDLEQAAQRVVSSSFEPTIRNGVCLVPVQLIADLRTALKNARVEP